MQRDEILALIDASGLDLGLERLKQALLPSIRLKTGPTASLEVGGSRLGGAPDLPAGTAWPRDGETPLTFIAQINLAEFAALPIPTDLPQEGLLSFFYDALNQPGGDPGDAGGWQVLYHSGPVSALQRTPRPPDLPLEARFPGRTITASVEWTLPHPFSHLIEHELGLLGEPYWQLYSAVHGDRVHHRMLGNAQNASGGLEWQLQRAAPGAEADWRLLLQVDSDAQVGFEWGDVGRLYYWIRQTDLMQRRFEQAWLLLQCS